MWNKLLVSFICLFAITNGIKQQNQTNEIINKISKNVTAKFATYCMTPNQENGFCVELPKCPILDQKALDPKHEAYDFMVASNCTPATAKKIKVCCGSKNNFDSQIERKQEATEANGLLADVNPLPKNCGTQKLLTFNKRILGGIHASVGEFPWMARIIHRNKFGSRSYGCSGFLIHPKFVLTAAHCVSSKLIEDLGQIFQVNLGDHNTSSAVDCADRAMKKCADPPQIIRTGQPMVYAGYDLSGSHNNDIALIPLKKPAEITNFVSPICLLDRKAGTDVFTVAGWGKTENENDSDVKIKVDVDRYPLQQCIQKYKEINIPLNKRNQFCAGGKEGLDSCTGDSGGPLMVEEDFKWYAEGIVSFGVGCGKKDWPGVYTNIPRYLDWIKKKINQKLERKHLLSTGKN